MQAGFIKATDPVAKVQPQYFADAAKRACETKYANAKATYEHVEESNLAYVCMDLVYQYTLLVDGFGKPKLLWLIWLCNFIASDRIQEA